VRFECGHGFGSDGRAQAGQIAQHRPDRRLIAATMAIGAAVKGRAEAEKRLCDARADFCGDPITSFPCSTKFERQIAGFNVRNLRSLRNSAAAPPNPVRVGTGFLPVPRRHR